MTGHQLHEEPQSHWATAVCVSSSVMRWTQPLIVVVKHAVPSFNIYTARETHTEFDVVVVVRAESTS